LLDIDMPNMDGLEACRRIKADPATASIPLLFLSADSLAGDKQKALALGALDYLQKPFRPEQLRSRVRSTLQPVPLSGDKNLVDMLTGLWNKKYFDAELKEQFVLAQLASQPLACFVTEIDQLSLINFRYGTAVANQVIRRVAGVLSSNGGTYATTCCLATRRFATLLRHNNRFDASRQADKLRKVLAQKLVLAGNVEVKVTCSFGVCDNQIASAETLFSRADNVLDRAANRGGNCVAVARAPAKAQHLTDPLSE
jgi:diguanylate cyclase (GGDEF)-like protein